MSEPKLKEISISAASGGKVAIIKYDLSMDYHISCSRSYDIPEDWTNEQAEEFQLEMLNKTRDVVDSRAQVEFDDLFAKSYMS